MKKFMTIIAIVLCICVSVVTICGVRVLLETKAAIAEMEDELMNAKEKYDEAISDFNKDEMFILANYDAYLAGYAYGYRLSLEERGYVIITERICTSAHDTYTLWFEALTGETFNVALQKAV